MENKKVSIIMPAYNASAFLTRSITSVKNQTYENWELLIVDDGSTDNSREIVQSFCAEDARIKLLCNQHGGTARARNTAIAVAQGDYFAFLDADDVYHPQYLELMLIPIHNCTNAISICEICSGTDATMFLGNQRNGHYSETTPTAAFTEMYEKKWHYYSSHCNKVYSRQMVNSFSFPDGRCFEDVATVQYAIYKASKINCIHDSLYFYYVTPNSSSKTKRSVELLDREWALRSHWEHFFREDREDLAYLAMPFYLVELISIYHRIELSDKPEDCQIIRDKFEQCYKQYRNKIILSDKQKDQILAFRHPKTYDIRNMVREQGIIGTIIGFVKRKLK